MVGERKKKYASGEGAKFMTRKQALQYLQLSLKYFRKICILKGIYPREPINRKRAQQGKATVQTLYSRKDIQFLSHEPLIWKLRELKIFSKKMAAAHALRDKDLLKKQLGKHPTFSLDHIIKERYPTFVDAVRDLDDCLSLCFLFGTFPSLKNVPREQSTMCRRLTIEFMHACIASRALRKIFVSIKGYYYQVQIMGETVTWLAPHQFSFVPLSTEEVDFRIMSSFAEFYVVMLGFVNFQLYQSVGLVYPPRMPALRRTLTEEEAKLVDAKQYLAERVAALNAPIAASAQPLHEDEPDIDHFPVDAENDEEMEKQKEEIAAAQRQKTLFAGLKVFLSREVPREPLVFALRCLGASVSWDNTLAVGATFSEDDETITHHIVDRPSLPNQYLSRYYVQPQWVFDCVNARVLLPVKDYLMGATLPPHLSPFVVGDRSRVYQPPEATPDLPRYIPPVNQQAEDKEESEDEEEEHEDEDLESKTAGMKVQRGSVQQEDKRAEGRAARLDRQLKEKMVARKHRRLYDSMVKTRKQDAKEIWLLRKKRRIIDQQKLQEQTQA